MARLNSWAFRGFNLNQAGARVRQMTGPFSLPPLRGDDFLTMGRTGRLFVPKIHDSRRISLEIVMFEDGVRGAGAQAFFDQLAVLFANRSQGSLTYTDLVGYTRTGQAECVGWVPADQSVVGLIHRGVADFQLADPWLYGATVSGSVMPNAGLAWGTPVANQFASRTSYTLPTGVVSGQPIIVGHVRQGGTATLTSITDTFSTPYTWTKIDGNVAVQDIELYIGTGGVGTSGVITVSAASGIIGGFAVPLTGASTAAGLLAVDVHANQSGTLPALPALSMTPTAAGEGVIAWMTSPTGGVAWLSPLTTGSFINYGSAQSMESACINPANGVAFVASGSTAYGSWGAAAAIIKGSGAPVPLNITNPGTALAEKLTLDFLGPIANPSILNTTNGTSVTINTTVAGTKHLLVDTGAFTALNDGANVIGSVVHSGAVPFLTLAPGLNVLQISGAACTGSTLVTVSFAPPWA